MSGLFDAILARGGVGPQVSDRAWLQALLDVEAALARASGLAGLVPSEDAEAATLESQPAAADETESAVGAAAALVDRALRHHGERS